MPFIEESVDLSDKNARAAAASRKTCGADKLLANCWGSVQFQKNNTWVGEYQTADSSPGGSSFLHCERGAIQLMLEGKGIECKSAQSDGKSLGEALRNANITSLVFFTELPPCPECRNWYNAISTQVPVRVKYIDELEDYWDKKYTAYARHKKFAEWISKNFG